MRTSDLIGIMEAQRAAWVLVIFLCVFHCAHTECPVADGSCNKSLRKLSSTARTALQKAELENVRYEVCAIVGGTIYYCPGDMICCAPGSPTSRCCPADHPLCIGNEYCCRYGYPKVCGDYCCTSDSYCCDDINCCASEDQCCGPDQCCQEQAPCCTGPDGETCCDKDTMACCDSLYECVSPCTSPFDAIGCEPISAKDDSEKQSEYLYRIAGPPQVECPSPSTTGTLYRILRTDESCVEGLIAKDPSKQRTVLSHVNCGGRPKYTSQFISFISSMEVANYYKNKFGPALRIATVDIQSIPQQCTLIDLTTATNRDEYLGNAVCKNFAKASCEVLLSCGEARVPCTLDSNVSITGDASELRVNIV